MVGAAGSPAGAAARAERASAHQSARRFRMAVSRSAAQCTPRGRARGARLGGCRGRLARVGRLARRAARRARHLPVLLCAARGRRAVTAVRPACAADLRAVSLVLARAFRGDPVHRWILPSELAWAVASDGFFAMVMRDMLRHQSVFTTEGCCGAALWVPPYSQPATLRERLGMAARWYGALGRRAGGSRSGAARRAAR